MSSYPFFIPEFVLCANSSLFSFKIANEPSEFRNYLLLYSVRKNGYIIIPFDIITQKLNLRIHTIVFCQTGSCLIFPLGVRARGWQGFGMVPIVRIK